MLASPGSSGSPTHLHLFPGVAVVGEGIDLRDQVEGDLLRIEGRLHRAAVEQVGGLARQLAHPSLPEPETDW